MFRRSQRSEAAKARTISKERNEEAEARRLRRKKGVDKLRSTSLPIQRRRILSGSSGDSGKEEDPGLRGQEGSKERRDSLDTSGSIEWDPTYDKCSTLKDVSDILDLTVCQVRSQAQENLSDSVAINLAPADFALPDETQQFLSDQVRQNLSVISEASKETISSEDQKSDDNELLSTNILVSDILHDLLNEQILSEHQDSSSMDENTYRDRKKALEKVELTIQMMLQEFNHLHVTYEDREEYKTVLNQNKAQYAKYRDATTDLVSELDRDDEADKQRIDIILLRAGETSKLVSDHAVNVKRRVTEVIIEYETRIPPVAARATRVGAAGDERKKDLAIKTKMKAGRLETRARALIAKIARLDEPSDMLERDIRREISVEFQERAKEAKDISEGIHDALENFATLEDEDRDEAAENLLENRVEEMLEEVEQRKTRIRAKDKSLGLCTEYPNPSKNLVPTPEIFKGKVGTNIYKFNEKFLEYIEAAQIREKDKVDTLRKFLSGDAKLRIGDHHKTLKAAMQCLVDNYGNPRAIWAESKKDLLAAVGNYGKDWGKHGSQERVASISRCVEFLREAESLARDYPELVNDIYSTATFELLTRVLPFTYIEKIDDAIGNVRTSDTEKMSIIMDYLEVKQQGALVAATRAKDETGSKLQEKSHNSHDGPPGAGNRDDWEDRNRNGRGRPRQDDHQKGHDCSKDRRCKTSWGLLGCAELYSLDTVSERKEFMRTRKGCFKCGDFPCHYFQTHKCTHDGKEAVWCTDQGCKKRPAALCDRHSPNASPELVRWLKSNKVKTTVSVAIITPEQQQIQGNMAATDVIKTDNAFMNDVEVDNLQSGKSAKNMPDSQLAEYFRKILKKKNLDTPEIKPLPAGECVFLFCILQGKTRPLQAFIDSGCNTMLTKEGVPEKELVSAQLRRGPITVGVAGGGVTFASGLWACLLPMSDGSKQVVKTLTMNMVTSDMPLVDLEPVYKDIKKRCEKVKAVQNLKVPKEVGGQVDLLIGIRYLGVFPEAIHTLPNGLTIYKSKFKSPWPDVMGCIGGPVEALECIAGVSGNMAALTRLQDLACSVENFAPRLEYFPDRKEFLQINNETDAEMDMLGLLDETFPNSSNHCMECFYLPDRDSPDELINLYKPHNKNPQATRTLGAGFSNTRTLGAGFSKSFNLCEQEDCFTSDQEMRKFMEYQEAGLDHGFKCPKCRDCKKCRRGAGYEKVSMKQEAEQEVIKESVHLDKESKRAVAKLAFIANPVENLGPNRFIALKRLDNVCRRYSKEPNVVKMVCEKVAKLHRTGHVKYWEDLSADQQENISKAPRDHYLCWDVGFKEDSLSTPARTVFDASATTPGGKSLNDILAKGITELARLVEIQLNWMMGRFGVTGDVSQAYNAMLLFQDHWAFQRILLKDNLDSNNQAREAVVTSAIYGVRCVGGQLEVLCGILADECQKDYPHVAEFLQKFRYVDDFAKSVDDKDSVNQLIIDTEKVLSEASMDVKAWAFSGEDPPEKLTPDGVSVCLAGMVWYTKLDMYRINYDSLHFGKKKRGRYPPDLLKLNGEFKSIDEFVPVELTRRNCARVAGRLYDLRGDVAPLLLRLKHDLRMLILKGYDWDDSVDVESRKRWIENFTLMEDVREFLFMRCPIPEDAMNLKARLWILADAADSGLIVAVFCGFLRKCGTYSCKRIFGKGLLGPEEWTIPAKELHAMSVAADISIFLKNALGKWLDEDEIYLGSDSRIALAWVVYEKVKLDVFHRNRVSNIRSKAELHKIFHVDGKENVADIGTRPDHLTIKSFCPGSEWDLGKPWMKMKVADAVESGAIKLIENIKLEDEDKKVFKKGITYDYYSSNPSVVALAPKQLVDFEKLKKRVEFSEYVYDPLKRSFKSMVRVTALVLKAVRLFKRKRLLGLVKKGKANKDVLKECEIPPAKFSVFSICGTTKAPDISTPVSYLKSYFLVHCHKLSDLGIILTEEDLGEALTYLYSKATKEIYEFVAKKVIEKEGIESDGILYAKSRILEGQELRVLGELDEMLDLESFTGVKFRVPLIEKNSPLAVSIAIHMHYNVTPHKGSESVFRMSLQHAKVINGKSLYSAIEDDCIKCKILKKQYLEQMMGPLADSQISISPVFYFSLLDLWGPIKTYCPGYERTRFNRGAVTMTKHYEVYFMVVACVVTGAVNVQVIERRNTGGILDGLSRFMNECCVPKVMLPDADGAMMEALREGVIELSDLEGTLSVDYGIQFETCMPQGHWEHGRVERRIRMLQESLERSGLKGTRCHATGLQTIAKAIERQVNDVPLGFLEQSTRGGAVLRILTPNMLKMNTRSNRAPKGLLTIPGQASDLIKNIEKGFNLWYQVWNEVYLPMAAGFKKWFGQDDNLAAGDIVLFKLKDSKMASTWRLGKVENVHEGRDELVRSADICYKNVEMGTDIKKFMVVQRPVRQVVKLFHINDTTLLSDISKATKAIQQIINKKNKSMIEPNQNETKEKEIEPVPTETEAELDGDFPIDKTQEDTTGDDTEREDDDTGNKEVEGDENESFDNDKKSGENDTVKSKRKSELEKLQIENEKFWKDFDERRPRRSQAAYSFLAEDTIRCCSSGSVSEDCQFDVDEDQDVVKYEEMVNQLQEATDEEEMPVFLL